MPRHRTDDRFTRHEHVADAWQSHEQLMYALRNIVRGASPPVHIESEVFLENSKTHGEHCARRHGRFPRGSLGQEAEVVT